MHTIHNLYRNIFLILLIAFGASACEKIVSVDLNKTSPQLVIEAIISDKNDSTYVKLSKSGNYFDFELSIPPVSGALVLITDDRGVRDTLRETKPGLYKNPALTGAPGRTYSLLIQSEGNQYTAVAAMPKKVGIDSLYTVIGTGRNGDPVFNLYVNFRDPPELGNYYRLNFYVGALAADSVTNLRYRLYRDKLSSGDEVNYRMRLRRNVNLGDTVTVVLYSIDKGLYDFYNTMNTIVQSDRSPTLLAPANPITNLSAGLGFFAVYEVDEMKIVLKK